jgi:hypothetical protein
MARFGGGFGGDFGGGFGRGEGVKNEFIWRDFQSLISLHSFREKADV